MPASDTALASRMSIVQHLSDAPWKKRAAFMVGGILAGVFTTRAREVEAGQRVNSKALLDRLIRNGIRAKALQRGDHRKLRDMLRKYWSVDGAVYAECRAHRFQDDFLAHDAAIFDEVEQIAGSFPLKQIYEIGCGNGKVLEYLTQRLPLIERLVGIDIDEKQIARNQQSFEHPKLSFAAAGALEWIQQHTLPGSLVVSNGGVLEYFLEDEVAALFQAVGSAGDNAIALIETLGSNHDLESNPATHPYGPELSFSHNYPALLKAAGFNIAHQSERVSQTGIRWLRVLAVTR